MRNGPEDMKYELPGGRACVNPFLEADQIDLSGLEAVGKRCPNHTVTG
jgi:hypothetical protein